jgi:decaprenylphospho-beta-D-ribofuranose 2-oxidase
VQAPGEFTLLSGWGRSSPSGAWVRRVQSASDATAALSGALPRGVLARGLGRSYGDAAQNAGGVVLDMTQLVGVKALDVSDGLLTADAGASFDSLMRALLPHGWFVPVTPGTRYVTLGGAIAADIHGKNHHRDGALSRHITSLTLRTPSGETLIAKPGDDAFEATCGGMGLTGVILEATMRLIRVETSRVLVDTERASDLDDAMARMESGDDRYRYSVAWIDCLARGASLGRSVLTRGDHATSADVGRADALAFAPRSLASVPGWIPGGLLRTQTVRAFNEVWFRKAPRTERGRIQSIAAFFHPLDGIRGWNRLYGRRGFVQYQFVVPFGREDALRSIVGDLSDAQHPSFLAVLKRFGAQDGMLAFPIAGWTLAVDIPAGVEGLSGLLDRFDERVAEAGGRVYLAKDGRMRPEVFASMYPRLKEWRAIRERLDPAGTMRSDLARRLELA